MRFILLTTLAILPLAPAAAQSSADAAAAFNKCGAITNDAERLACFDRALHETTVDRPRAIAAEREKRAKSQREQFGLNPAVVEEEERKKDPTRPPPVKQVEVQVVRADVDAIGHWTIQLTDGAVWQQTEIVPTFHPPHRGDAVTIRKGVIGGYLLEFGSQAATRVVRIR
ncbi:MAG: hypothetical protein ACM3YM_06130 [Sphingomonadales bacterium]